MFNKRKTVAIRYDDAVDTLDGDENKLRFLISHGIIEQADNTLELNDNYLRFFENVLEVNEDINVESVRQYIGRLQLNIESYLAADSDQRRRQFLREIRHTLRSIDQTTHRNIIDLKRNVENTYKQEPNYRLKKIRLGDFDRKSRDISELIKQTEQLTDRQTVFFRTAMDALLQQTVHDVARGLSESAHALIDIQKQIIDYLNRIRTRAGIPPVTANSVAADGALLKTVLNERFAELYFEGMRFEDIRRYLQGAERMSRKCYQGLNALVSNPSFETFNVPTQVEQVFSWSDREYIQPIPDDELYSNPQLVQAPGY